jgi:predicted acetyltransferase
VRRETSEVIDIRPLTDDDSDGVFRLDGRLFAAVWDPVEIERQRSIMENDRFRVAIDDGAVVAMAGSYGLQMTVPGGAALPTGGVTFVGVSTTHRRRGLLGRLIDDLHADIAARGEPLAALTASEGGIYERFGYGVATHRRITLIDRRRVQIAAAYVPEKPSVRVIEHDDPSLPDELRARWARIRTQRAGEIDRSPAWFGAQIGDRGAATTWVLHDDGFASWKMAQHWNEGHPAHEVEVLDVAAATPDAHAALWHTILSLDLVGPIRCRALALDDPLPYLLTDPRALRTVELNDFIWCLPLDVPACFAARTYGTDDDLVIESAGTRWRVGPGGCKVVRTRPDLVAARSALGPLLMGVSPTTLAGGRRLRARSAEALRRADALLVTHPGPHGMSGF